MYRGKRKDTGEWVYGYLIGKDVIVGDIVEFCEEYFNCEYWWRVDPKTVGQYTGQHDRNEREIYEGDIIRVVDTDEDEEWTFVVEYEDGGYWFDVTKLIYDFDVCSFGFVNKILDYLEYEIIGNIHDHPHLLKGVSE